MGAMQFPHLASLAYFHLSSTPCTITILQPQPLTPRRMLSEAPASSTMVDRRRRYSGIPRPASGSSRRRATSSTQQMLVSCEITDTDVRPSSHQPSQTRSPRSDSLQLFRKGESQHRDLSGVQQQFHVKNFSTQSVQSLEELSSPRVTAVRSLMRPLGPPLPRSHTMGNVAFHKQASSPAGSQQRVVFPGPSRMAASPEIDVVDALHESRMTREEVELLNRVEKEKELNRAHLLKLTRTPRTASSPSQTKHTTRDSDIKGSSLLSPGSATSRVLSWEHMRWKTADSNGTIMLRIDPTLANSSRAPRASLPDPKSAQSITSSPNNIGPSHVYFSEPVSYWTGRYIALCDKSKTQALVRMVSLAEKRIASDDEQHGNAQHEPFETVEHRRMRSILENLRSCCQSEQALKSFEKFEDSFLMMRSGTPAATNKPATVTTSTAGATGITVTNHKIRHPWLFGSTSIASTAASRATSDSKTIPSNKLPSTPEKAISLVKSKTTGNLAATGYAVGEDQAQLKGSAALLSGRIQHTRQPSHLSMQAQTNVRALREREERAARRVEEIKRRVTSKSVSGITMPVLLNKHTREKARGPPSSHVPEARPQQAELSTTVIQLQGTHAQPRARRLSVTSPSLSRSENAPVNTAKNRKVPNTNSRSQVLSDDEALAGGQKHSVPRELRRRTNRQSSGEMLKSMVTGGLKGVRRMGRSLTGRSELEELGQSFNRVDSRSDLGEKRWMSRSDQVEAAL